MKAIFLLALVGCLAGNAHAEEPLYLTLAQARQLALKQHPDISVAALSALASEQVMKEVRSALLPSIFASATAVDTADPNNTRVAAGGLNNPLIYEREADGATISQLITDFGRSTELTRSANLRFRSQQMNLQATRAQILLEVDNAYFSALASQSVLSVARQTLAARQLILEQTETMATNKLKSELDVSFVRVDYDNGNLLLAKARNDLEASFAVLSTVLGEARPLTFILADEPLPEYVTNNSSAFITEALAQRPDLAQLRFQRDAAKEFAKAEGKLAYPTISAVGAAGLIPTGNSHLASDYAAAGINLTVPLFTGGLDTARRREAELRAKVAEETLRGVENQIARDTHIASLNLDYAYQRMGLTYQLLTNANEALTLAKARFDIGSASIVELTQAELNQTSAQIDAATARYDYQIRYSALDFQLGRLK